MSDESLEASAFRAASVLLSGTVDYAMYNSLLDQLGRAPESGNVVVELSTLGGATLKSLAWWGGCSLSQRPHSRPAFCFSRQGRHLSGGYDVHVVLRTQQPLSYARHR